MIQQIEKITTYTLSEVRNKIDRSEECAFFVALYCLFHNKPNEVLAKELSRTTRHIWHVKRSINRFKQNKKFSAMLDELNSIISNN
jgi:hypothetical protein